MSASSEREGMPQRQLGELMTELGLISEEQLATVLEVQQQSKRPLGQIIVELGFASGAAVAHALAMQSGGALRTEYGFALGVPPKDKEAEPEETRGGLPKFRLAATAVAVPAQPAPEPSEDGTEADSAESEAVPEAIDTQPEPEEIAEVAAVEEAEETEAGAEETPEAEPEDVPEEAETSAETPLAVETDSTEVGQLRGEIERLEAALGEAQATAGEQE